MRLGRLLFDSEELIEELDNGELDTLLQDSLNELVDKKSPEGYWSVTGRNLGWRKASGLKRIKALTFTEILTQILPRTENHFRIHNFGKGFAINNYHHDSPCGEWYYIRPITQDYFYRMEGHT